MPHAAVRPPAVAQPHAALQATGRAQQRAARTHLQYTTPARGSSACTSATLRPVALPLCFLSLALPTAASVPSLPAGALPRLS